MDAAKRRFNWWIPAFVVMALAFEVAREWAVLAQNEPVTGSGLMVLWSPQSGYATAEGQWVRSDGGSPIVANSIAIRCEKEPTPRCIEASTNALGDSRAIHTSIDVFDDVQFSADGVTYTNALPDCATYSVRLDGNQKRVTATRTAKDGATCLKLERRVVMELQDGIKGKVEAEWQKDHFLPILSLLKVVLG